MYSLKLIFSTNISFFIGFFHRYSVRSGVSRLCGVQVKLYAEPKKQTAAHFMLAAVCFVSDAVTDYLSERATTPGRALP
ncbi:MAG: hypothetical protein IJW17_07185, partial [Lentisphaeria bacterium]|nr:hypothetical protein [Lentisphaeria bacterium]